VTCRGTRGEVGAVGVRWTRDGSKPAVEEDEVLCHGVEDRNVLRGVVVDNFGRGLKILVLVGNALLRDETIHEGRGCVVGMERTIDLHVSTTHAMVWVIRSHVQGSVGGANLGVVGWICDIDWIAVFAVSKTINLVIIGETTSKCVEGAVLEDEDDDVLDLVLPALALFAVVAV